MKNISRRRITVQTLLILLTVVVVFIVYGYLLGRGNWDKTYGVLFEVSQKNATILKNDSDQTVGNIANLAYALGSFDLLEHPSTMEYLRRYAEERGFRRLGIAFVDGSAITTDGHEYNVASRTFFNQVLNGTADVSNVLMDTLDRDPVIVCGAPIIHDGEAIGILFATYSVDRYIKALTISSYNDEGYSYIVTPYGECVVGSTHPDSFGMFQNIFAKLTTTTPDNLEMAIELRKGMADGRNGMLSFIDGNGDENYMYYQPVNVNDWYILTVIPVDVVTKKTQGMLFWSYGFIVFCGVMLLFLVFNVQRLRRARYDDLERLAYVDELTGGASYAKFKLDVLRLRHEYPGMKYALISLDIDHFQYVNDVYGFEEGDTALRFLWKCLSDALHSHEAFARVSDDHFVILVGYMKSLDELKIRFLEFAEQLKTYHPSKDFGSYNLAVSAGVYPLDPADDNVDTMVSRAKTAQKRTKGNASSSYTLYSDDLRRELLQNKYLENRFDQALENKEFIVYYQPKFNLKGECFGSGAEALVRWIDSDGKLLSPGVFIPVFERNGDIVRLDQYVFDSVCRDIRRWLDEGLSVPPISVNVSRRQLLYPSFVSDYLKIIRRHGIPAGCVQMEFTETMLIDNEQMFIEVVKELHANGILIQMDDFGSGYSSLNMLRNVPVDILKLDKRFVDDIESDLKSRDVVVGAITLAHILSMDVTAEGVETKGQYDILRTIDCDYIQGYYCARPMPVADYEKILRGEA